MKTIGFALFALLVARPLGVGCANDTSNDAASDDELGLSGSEVVGDITVDGVYREVQAPRAASSKPVTRAFRFHAGAGDEMTADVVPLNASDAVASILDAKYRTLTSNDDALPGNKDPHIIFKAPKAGTYYLAFRNKEGWATKYEVRLQPGAIAALPAARWSDGWPESPTGRYAFELSTPASDFSINASCISDPLDTTDYSFHDADILRCNVDVNAKTMRCNFPDLLDAERSTTIADDGSFTFGVDDSTALDTLRASGTVGGGGVVSFEDVRTQGCHRNSDDALIGSRHHMRGVSGRAQ